MKHHYDFSKGKRGRVLPPEPEPEGKTRITIRLDQDIVDCFLRIADESGGKTGYQTLINAALREYLDGKAPAFEETLRRIIREELKSRAEGGEQATAPRRQRSRSDTLPVSK